MKLRTCAAGAAGVAAILSCSCATHPNTGAPPAHPTAGAGTGKLSELEVQALVMKMADEYMSALGEAMTPVVRNSESANARTAATGFMQSAISAALDIATEPNPGASVLDLLVLSSLQTWALRAYWIPAGIPADLGAKAEERLRLADADLWRMSSKVLSRQQQEKLRSLIDDWIAANPDRQLVSFVRFEEFTDQRTQPNEAERAKAQGLLHEVVEATTAVESARLLGERALWFAARYPYLIGQQAEKTMFRAAEQPEVQKALGAVDSIQKLTTALTARVETLDRDLDARVETIAAQVRAERTAAIEQAGNKVAEVSKTTLEEVVARYQREREATIAAVFDRLGTERRALLDDLQARDAQLRGLAEEIRVTMGASTGLAKELTGTLQGVDRVVARFDREAGSDRKPLEIKDLRDAATEAGKAAEKLTALLQQSNEIAKSGVWDERLAQLDRATQGTIDRAFWRGLVLVVVFLAGLLAIRLVPPRVRAVKGS